MNYGILFFRADLQFHQAVCGRSDFVHIILTQLLKQVYKTIISESHHGVGKQNVVLHFGPCQYGYVYIFDVAYWNTWCVFLGGFPRLRCPHSRSALFWVCSQSSRQIRR
jgi:hypothetical protein